MALVKTILKNDYRETIIKFVGTGTDTIVLNTLGQPEDPNPQYPNGTPFDVVILSISITQADNDHTDITRNGQTVIHAHGNWDFQTDGIITAVLKENSGSDIVVNATQNNTCTIIIRLKKLSGFTAPYEWEDQK